LRIFRKSVDKIQVFLKSYKTGNGRTNVTTRRVRVTIVAVDKH